MGWLWLLLVMLVFWWLISAADKKSRVNVTSHRDAEPGQLMRQAESSQPSVAVETAPDGEQTQTITVNLDVQKILDNLKNGNPQRARWSGKIDGPLPIKTLTFRQDYCLSHAAYGKRIIPYRSNESFGATREDVEFHPARTVDVLVKHGFLVADGKGAFVCTDLGLRAFETLPARLN